MGTVKQNGFEWDDVKNARNIEKHSLGFWEASTIFKGVVLEIPSPYDYGEERTLAIGILEGKEILVVYTEREDTKRIISARRARKNEREAYWKSIQTQNE